jgi:hypothetical protein
VATKTGLILLHLAVAGALAPSHAGVQMVLSLGPATGRVDPETKSIFSIRELKDGRVLLADLTGRSLLVVDFAKGTALTAARKGRGPGEFQAPGPLCPAGADTTLMRDWDYDALYLIVRTTIVKSTVSDRLDELQSLYGRVTCSDRNGTALFVREQAPPPGDKVYDKRDSSTVLRFDFRVRRADSLARLLIGPKRTKVVVDEKGNITSEQMLFPFFSASESVVLFSDGWLAIARLDPYRVDWLSPTGQWTYGKPLGESKIPFDESQKRVALEWYGEQFGMEAPAASRYTWPDIMPPFTSWVPGRPALPSPDGRLLIWRTISAGHLETKYDVIDRRGRREAQLVLAPNERIVGFGTRNAYIVVTDSNGRQFLERHAWPAVTKAAPRK